ncbi:NUDIX hydrolase [Prosthecomicrobium pneumaticum]|uniref:8-oxo-dGTP pyrophosphatase MutT (NUDIX family) n=1 Tax=Prosthecomicrobium pneumaticum TaxID=81895 RepID=A0A7W9FKA7_9HYPH|nr:NUDIX hydrolase [Prosthecomicrobium pneumaticum]MBB5752577.1 8-oxo-dGTP pyrophosphatase MutT (NUDIX family) [Prosthecomicrobium pneumaticum]
MAKKVGVLPWRRVASGVEVLLITTRDTRRWVVPKGSIERDLSAQESAEREAFEEAGVLGVMAPLPIGSFRHARGPAELGADDVALYAMQVRAECAVWPEHGQRDIEWLPIDQAAERVDSPELAALIRRFAKQEAA